MKEQKFTMSEFVNDAVRSAVNEEMEEFEDRYMYLSPEETLKLADDLHKYRTINAYIQKHDLPTRCAIGYYAYAFIFPVFKEHFGEWQNDSDEAVAEFLKSIGKALFEDIQDEGESTDDVYNIVMSWKGDDEDDDR